MDRPDYIAPAKNFVIQPSGKEKIDARSAQLIAEERHYINAWRKLREDVPSDDGEDLAGLALSGGGIRSATFSLGIMQALAHHELLKKMDYLSTVSGGGYIGSAVTWLTSALAQTDTSGEEPKRFGVDKDDFPTGTDNPLPGQPRETKPKQQRMLRYLREHGYYLTPGAGINAFSLLASILRGMLLNLVVWVPTFVLSFMLLLWLPGLFTSKDTQPNLPVYDRVLQWATPELLCPVLTNGEI